MLLIDAAGQKTAIHDKHVPGDETGRVRSKKNGSADELFDFSEALHGSADEKFAAAFGAIEQFCVQVGAKDSGSDGIHADAVFGPLDGKRFCERGDSGFAGGVSGDFIKRNERAERSDVDDAAVTIFDHVAADDFAGAKGSVEIGFENAGPFFFGDLQGGSALCFSSAVHENVDVAEFRGDFLEQIFDSGFVGDIAGDGERLAAEGFDLPGGSGDEFGAASGGDDVGSRDGESFGKREADTTGASNNDCRFVRKIELRVPHACGSSRFTMQRCAENSTTGRIE